MRKLLPDTSVEGVYYLTLEHILSREKPGAEKVFERRITDNEFNHLIWIALDGWVQNRMRWANRVDNLRRWCETLNVSFANIGKNDPLAELVTHIESLFGDMFAQIVPNRTWRILTLRKVGSSAHFVLEIGEDYRIVDWMKRHGNTR